MILAIFYISPFLFKNCRNLLSYLDIRCSDFKKMVPLVTESLPEEVERGGSCNSMDVTGMWCCTNLYNQLLIVSQVSDQKGHAVSRPLQLGSECCSEDCSHATEKSFTNSSACQVYACNGLNGHHGPRITTKEIIEDDSHSAEPRLDDLHDISKSTILDDKIITSFHHNDPESPYNWSRVRCVLIMWYIYLMRQRREKSSS